MCWYFHILLNFSSKNIELSKLQTNLDEVAKSLIKYSANEKHKYKSPGLFVEIRRNLEIPTVDFESESGDEIRLEVISSMDYLNQLSTQLRFLCTYLWRKTSAFNHFDSSSGLINVVLQLGCPFKEETS